MIMCYFRVSIILLSLLSILLTGCSTEPEPDVQATGFIWSGGGVRLWRLNTPDHLPKTMVTAFTPQKGSSVLSRYEFIDGKLYWVKRIINSKPEVIEEIRFSQDGEIVFQQRITEDSHEMIDSEQLTLVKPAVRHLLDVSEQLLRDQIVLRQGVLFKDELIKDCQGQTVEYALTLEQQKWLKRRMKNSNRIWLSWLESPKEKMVLLLVLNDNPCVWQPTKESLNKTEYHSLIE